MPLTVLLSIKPEFAEKILDGGKRYEYRRALFKETNIKKVVMYASSPICRVIGEFQIEEILEMPMRDLWHKTHIEAGISWPYFYKYFKGKDRCYAIRLKNPTRYNIPMLLKDAFGISRPPQSFAYIKEFS